MIRVLLCLGGLLALATAQEAEKSAASVARAVETGDAAALKALAERDNPDPWVVADRLCAQGKFDAAAAFAKAAPRKDTERLAAYVAPRRANPQQDDFVAARTLLERGKAHQSARAYEKSEQAFTEAAQAAARVGWWAGQAWALLEAARSAFRRADFPGTIRFAEAALAVEKKLGCRQGVARATRLRASALTRLGRRDEALAGLERARALAAEVGDAECQAHALTGLGYHAAVSGKSARALEAWQQALSLMEKIPADPAIARFRSDPELLIKARIGLIVNTATIAHRAGQADEATDLSERAVREANDAGIPVIQAQARMLAGALAQRRGDNLRALEHYEAARELARQAGDRAKEAALLRRLGGLRQELGDYPSALELNERAVKLLTELKVRRDAAIARLYLGNTLLAMGEHARALDVYDRVRGEAEALDDAQLKGNVLARLAIVHQVRGAHAAALAMLRASLKVRETAGDKEGVVRSLRALGTVHAALGETDRARELYEDALRRCDASVPAATKARLMLVLGNLAEPDAALGFAKKAHDFYARAKDLYGMAQALSLESGARRRRGEHEQAIAVDRRALELCRRVGRPAGIAKSELNIALSQLALGQRDEALSGLTSAVQEADDSGWLDAMLECRWGLAYVHGVRGEYEQAIAVARDALTQMERLGAHLAEGQGAGARARFAPVFEVGADAALRLGDAEALAFFLESGRARTLLKALGGRDVLRASVVPEDLRTREAGQRAEAALALERLRQARATRKRKAIRAARQELSRARGELQEVIEEIQSAARARADLAYPTVAPLDRLRASLAPGEALVLYGLFKPNAIALVVLPQGDARIVDLGRSAEIAATCRDLLGSLADSEQAVSAATLRKLVWDPLGVGKETKRLLVSPDGVLAYLPFQLVTDDREVVYVPSGTAHAHFKKAPGKRGTQVLAVGDPVYKGALAPLPGSRAEATAVGNTVLLGEDASETRLLETVGKTHWRAIHLACHGLIDEERPALSSLALTADAKSDGRLTTLDVFRLELSTDLVMLSACETGKGKVVRGEGIFGFSRAFLFAGASRVIVSLWKVDDAATKALMVRFYELWHPKDGKKSLPTATALSQAQEFVRGHEKWKHPHYWAAWQLWGYGAEERAR